MGEDTTNTEYDLVPLTNKVRILSDGLPHCFDVGVFPHPYSCKKFINCYRNPGQGIQGSIYQCPSYLAFDPVGGRCNWVNEIVCASRSWTRLSSVQYTARSIRDPMFNRGNPKCQRIQNPHISDVFLSQTLMMKWSWSDRILSKFVKGFYLIWKENLSMKTVRYI